MNNKEEDSLRASPFKSLEQPDDKRVSLKELQTSDDWFLSFSQ